MDETVDLRAEFDALHASFWRSMDMFNHHLREDRLAESRAIHMDMKANLERQREIRSRLEELIDG